MSKMNPIQLVIYKTKALFIRKSSIRQLNKLKDSHKGERCFIIGNGPSLAPEDLDKLKKEFCFASNRIDKMFGYTDWRPTFYCTQDITIIQTYRDILKKIHAPYKLMVYAGSRKIGYIGKALYTPFIDLDFYPNPPTFSEDIAAGIGEGFTVTYTCMQIAAYMGFKEMYLIGMDHNFPVDIKEDGTVVKNDVKSHFYDKEKNVKTHVYPMLYKTELSYKTAKEYADKHDIKIYNATRGGKLEIFERVDLDSLF